MLDFQSFLKRTAMAAVLISATMSAAVAAASGTLPNPEPITQGGEEVFITDIEMARDDGAGRGGQVVGSFRAKDNPLHCLVTLSRAQQGTRVAFVWTAVDAGGKRDEALASAEVVTGPREIIADGQLRHPREWPAGRYRVQATVNGRTSRAVEFTIN